MPYTVDIADTAARDLAALPRRIRRMIRRRILALATDPRPSWALWMWGEWEGYWRFRVGEYRVIYEIEDRAAQVRIARVGQRSEVYQRRRRE